MIVNLFQSFWQDSAGDLGEAPKLTIDNLAGNLNVFLASHEHQYVSWWKAKVYCEYLLHCAVDVILAG